MTTAMAMQTAQNHLATLTPEVVQAVLHEIRMAHEGSVYDFNEIDAYARRGGRDLVASSLVRRLPRAEATSVELCSFFVGYVARVYPVGEGALSTRLRLLQLQAIISGAQGAQLRLAGDEARDAVLMHISSSAPADGECLASKAWAAVAECVCFVEGYRQGNEDAWDMGDSPEYCARNLAAALTEDDPSMGDDFLAALSAFVDRAENAGRKVVEQVAIDPAYMDARS